MTSPIDRGGGRSASGVSRFLADGSGHDWHHIHRVWRLSRQIALREGADLEVTELAALVHDIADWKFHGGDDTCGPVEAERLLMQEGASPEVIVAVKDIVATISFKGAGVTTAMNTLEGQCVQDADRLDAIGAIGIARCFAYGGHAGRLMHDPDEPAVMHASAEAYKVAKGTSLNHFYEKLFLLKDRVNTATGRALAEERHQYMQDLSAASSSNGKAPIKGRLKNRVARMRRKYGSCRRHRL